VQDQGIASEVIPEAVGPTAIRRSDPPGGAIDPGTLLRKDRQDARVVQPQERSGRDVVEAGGKRLGTAKEREHLTVPRTTVFPDQHAGGLCPIRELQSPGLGGFHVGIDNLTDRHRPVQCRRRTSVEPGPQPGRHGPRLAFGLHGGLGGEGVEEDAFAELGIGDGHDRGQINPGNLTGNDLATEDLFVGPLLPVDSGGAIEGGEHRGILNHDRGVDGLVEFGLQFPTEGKAFEGDAGVARDQPMAERHDGLPAEPCGTEDEDPAWGWPSRTGGRGRGPGRIPHPFQAALGPVGIQKDQDGGCADEGKPFDVRPELAEGRNNVRASSSITSPKQIRKTAKDAPLTRPLSPRRHPDPS